MLGFLPLSLIAAPAVITLPSSTLENIQEQVTQGQQGIDQNAAETAAEQRRQNAINNAPSAQPSNTVRTPPPVPAKPQVHIAPPVTKPVVTDSTQAAQSNAANAPSIDEEDANTGHQQAPTGFSSGPSGQPNSPGGTGSWDYGF